MKTLLSSPTMVQWPFSQLGICLVSISHSPSSRALVMWVLTVCARLSSVSGEGQTPGSPYAAILLTCSWLIHDASVTLIPKPDKVITKRKKKKGCYAPVFPNQLIHQVNRIRKKTHDHLNRCRKEKDLMKFNTHYHKGPRQMRRKLS